MAQKREKPKRIRSFRGSESALVKNYQGTESLGAAIVVARLRLNRKQADLSNKTAIAQQMISRWEKDRYRPSNKRLLLLSEVLNAPELMHWGGPVHCETCICRSERRSEL